jgi:hypothetical protein
MKLAAGSEHRNDCLSLRAKRGICFLPMISTEPHSAVFLFLNYQFTNLAIYQM